MLGDRNHVTGVRVRNSDGTESELRAKLIIDTSGRASRTPQWLTGLGINGLREDRIDSGLVYASRVYRAPVPTRNWPVVAVQADPRLPRPAKSGAILPIEGDRWHVSVMGAPGGHPTGDAEAFEPFARTLRHPIMADLIKAAEPLTDVKVTHSTANRRLYYERLSTWPEGLVVLGDSAAAFNPIYGHGMSVAAQGALALCGALSTGPTVGLARRAQRAIGRRIDTAWALAVGTDIHFSTTTGQRPNLTDRLLHRHVSRLSHTATGSFNAATALTDVLLLHLVALSQGDTERARALTESAGTLPWRTVWTNWRAPGRLHRIGPDIPAVKRISASAHTVTTTFADRTSLEWDAFSGQGVESDNSRADIVPSPPLWHAEDPSWNLLRLRLSEDPAFVRAVQAPSLWAAACVGRLVVMAGDRGLYALEPDAHRSGSAGLPALPSVGPRCKIRPIPFDKTACEPTRARVIDVFTAETAPTLSDEQLPSGLTHELTRRFLKKVGFPAVSGFYGLDTHHLLDTGLVKHAWEGTKAFRTPVGDGPFYTLGSWIGGILLLDGPTGRVLRQSRPGAVDDTQPGDPLAGSSLASFVAMVCLQWEYMRAYTTSGGLDGADLLAELTSWLSALDPAAASTRNWGHVLDSDNFPYL
ncbi:SUKH-4 family immunity protein [Streptomyces sp. NPDC002766]|uniref:SUKH-4 family immunity protein n=1 Tax=Streptomyces sp. NPDC002766 TaxID=3154429 RepID=UPI003326E22C